MKEYKTLTNYDNEGLEDELNKLAKNGWKVISSSGDNNLIYIILERSKTK